MLDTYSLNSLNDQLVYSAHFMDVALWEPNIRQVCAWHGFKGNKIIPGVPGTYPTFIIDVDDLHGHPCGTIVLKFFGPLFNGADSFKIERDVGYWLEKQSLPIPSPGILADGSLDENWQYLVFEHINGMGIGQAREQLTKEDWFRVACQVGEYLHCLHDLSLNHFDESLSSLNPSMNTFSIFLENQRLNCATNHRAWNDLPGHLLDQIEGFILPVDKLIDLSKPLYLIHADLTSDHLLGKIRKGAWHTQAIIDWGDAMLGNVLYELVSIYLDLFSSDNTLLRLCLDTYDLPAFYRQDFPNNVLSMVLLHQFPMPGRIYAPYSGVPSLSELADCMFAV
jgi:hypothetical protein